MTDRFGVLLVNVGTPDAPETGPVRRYLREFLMDPYVLDMPAAARRLLVEVVILPRRPRVSAAAYRKIWLARGSPLLVHGQDLAKALAQALPGATVELAMRYQRPSIADALATLAAANVTRIVVVPLFPQYSPAAWHSAVERVWSSASRLCNLPALQVVPPFHAEPGFLDAAATVARPALAAARADKVMFSFHGLPERQCRERDATGAHCLRSPSCCDAIVDANRFCYRAQCFATARALAARLELAPTGYEVAFQSRLGRTPWIRPYTDVRLRELPAAGVRRLAVLCPSFVADCLETLEEIGIRGAADFAAAGGEQLTLVPCVNAHPAWVEGLAAIVRAHARSADAASADAGTSAAERASAGDRASRGQRRS